jgi:hypothetical protein
MWYRICWKNAAGGNVQRGRVLYKSAQLADVVAETMNALWPDTQHWSEATDEAVEAGVAVAGSAVRL